METLGNLQLYDIIFLVQNLSTQCNRKQVHSCALCTTNTTNDPQSEQLLNSILTYTCYAIADGAVCCLAEINRNVIDLLEDAQKDVQSLGVMVATTGDSEQATEEKQNGKPCDSMSYYARLKCCL